MLRPWVLLLGLGACELAGPDNFYPTLIDDQAVRADGSTVQYIYRADGPLVARRVTCAEAAANCVSEHRVYIYDGLQLRSEALLTANPRGTVVAFTPSTAFNTNAPLRVDIIEGGLQDDWGNRIATLSQAVTWGQGTLYSTPTPATHTLPVARSTVGNHVLFQAHLYDEDIGIYLMRARVYDPRTGQFLQRDPIPFVDGVNVYAGMANDPINYRDPTGELPVVLIGVLKMVALGLGIDVGLQLIRIAESDQLTLAHFDYHSLWKTAAYSAVGGPLLGRAAMFSPLVPRALGVVGAALGIGAASQDFADGNPITGSLEAALGVAAFRSAANWSRPCKCFTEDTEVWTPGGLVPIAQIKAGDKVHCTAPDGEWGTCAVVAPYSREYFGEMVALTVAGEIIQVTGGHPFWVEAGQNLAFRPIVRELGTETFVAGAKGRWVEAKDVLPGDQVKLGDDQVAAVKEIAAWSEALTVYNLTVEGEHTFAVGEPGVLVHNCSTRLANKLSAWRRYNGNLSMREWSKRYEQLKINIEKGAWLEAFLRKKLGFGTKGRGIQTKLGTRYPDATDGLIVREIKSGYVTFDKKTRIQIGKDFLLQKKGRYPEWHFYRGASKRVLMQLETFGIPYVLH